MVEYRELKAWEIEPALFARFIRHQVVTQCWRKENGIWVIKDDPFVDDWTEEEYRELVRCLKNTVAAGGFVYGAFVNHALKGFVSVESGYLDGPCRYMDLSSIHVSEDCRGQGIGRALFLAAKRWAKSQGGEALYISAHSAVESQAFYAKMGCVDARQYNPEHVRKEPWDRQLECPLIEKDIGQTLAELTGCQEERL